MNFTKQKVFSLLVGVMILGGIVTANQENRLPDIGISSSLSSGVQHIPEIVFVPDESQGENPQKITMKLEKGIITVDSQMIADRDSHNKLEGQVDNSFILGGSGNSIKGNTMISGNLIGGGEGNSIEDGNLSVILGGKENSIKSDESIILGGEKNKITGGKGIIIGNNNQISNTFGEKETIILGNEITATGGDNVLMGKGYSFSGKNSFVYSTQKGRKFSGDGLFMIQAKNGLAVNVTGNAVSGIVLSLKGSLQIQENENDPEEPIEGAIKMVNNCMCYGDGQKWKATKGDIFCDMICKKPGLKVGDQKFTCDSGTDLIKSANMSGDYWECIGSIEKGEVITEKYTICHTGFYFFSGAGLATGVAGTIYEGTGICKEIELDTPCATGDVIKGELAKTPQIHQIWSGTFQEYLPRSGRYYQPEQIAGECTYTCKNKYAYKIDSGERICRKLKVTFRAHDNSGDTQSHETTKANSVPSSPKEYLIGETIADKPTRVGYTFSGWRTAEPASVTDGWAKNIETIPSGTYLYKTSPSYTTGIRTDFVVDAIWKPNDYTITFNGYKGTGSTTPTVNPTSKTVTFDNQYGTLATAERVGYDFVGWFTAENGGTEKKSDQYKESANNETFYAHRTPHTYTVNFDAGGGNGSMYPITATFDQEFIVNNSFTRPGYTFDGWKITGMDTVSHTIGTSTSNSTSIDSTKATTFKNLTAVKNGSINFVALWRPNVLTINYYGNGAQYMDMGSTTINNNTLLGPDRFSYNQIIDECAPVDYSIPWGLRLSRLGYYANGIRYIDKVGGKTIGQDGVKIGEACNGETISANTLASALGKLTALEQGDTTVNLYAGWEVCPAGYYCPANQRQSSCPAGTYSSAGASSCTNCPCGTYSSAGASSCTSCGPKKYSSEGSSSCSTASQGYYANSSCSQQKCNPIEHSTWTSNGSNANNCEWECESGYKKSGSSCIKTTKSVRFYTTTAGYFPNSLTIGNTTFNKPDAYTSSAYMGYRVQKGYDITKTGYGNGRTDFGSDGCISASVGKYYNGYYCFKADMTGYNGSPGYSPLGPGIRTSRTIEQTIGEKWKFPDTPEGWEGGDIFYGWVNSEGEYIYENDIVNENDETLLYANRYHYQQATCPPNCGTTTTTTKNTVTVSCHSAQMVGCSSNSLRTSQSNGVLGYYHLYYTCSAKDSKNKTYNIEVTDGQCAGITPSNPTFQFTNPPSSSCAGIHTIEGFPEDYTFTCDG